jgi:hypothetical protein
LSYLASPLGVLGAAAFLPPNDLLLMRKLSFLAVRNDGPPNVLRLSISSTNAGNYDSSRGLPNRRYVE